MGRLIGKYRNLSVAVKASLWFVFCSIIQKGIAFFVVPIYTRMLSTAEYGTYSVFLSWTSIFYVFATLNMSAGVFNNGMIKYENKRSAFTSSIQGLSSVVCLLTTAILLLFDTFWTDLLDLSPSIIILMMIQIFFQAPCNYWMAKNRFEYRYRSIVIVALLSAIAIPVFSILLMSIMEDRTLGIILGTVLVYSIIGSVIFVLNCKHGKLFFDKEIWDYCLKFNIPLIPHYLSYIILGQADRVMINSICGASDAGIYALAYQISLVINLVTSAIDGSFNPWTYQKLKDGDLRSIRKVSNYLIGIFSIGVVGLILIAPEVLAFAAPSEYSVAKWIVPPVVCGCFYLFIAGTFMRVEFYHEKNTIIMIASICAAIFNIGLNAFFIPKFGCIAAAYTTLGSYILFSIFHFYAMKYTCKKHKYIQLPFDGRFIFTSSAITTCLSILLMVLYEFVIIRYVIIAVIMTCVIMHRKYLMNIFFEIRKRG